MRYVSMGRLPAKRHTQFRRPDGGLYREEVMGLEGFHGIQSILYHHFLPPRVVRTEVLSPALKGPTVKHLASLPLRHEVPAPSVDWRGFWRTFATRSRWSDMQPARPIRMAGHTASRRGPP